MFIKYSLTNQPSLHVFMQNLIDQNYKKIFLKWNFNSILTNKKIGFTQLYYSLL